MTRDDGRDIYQLFIERNGRLPLARRRSPRTHWTSVRDLRTIFVAANPGRHTELSGDECYL
jgi:hypothetical protein